MTRQKTYGSIIKNLMHEHGFKNIASFVRFLQEKTKEKITYRMVSGWIEVSYPPLEGIEIICQAFNIKQWEFFLKLDPEASERFENLHNEDIELANKIKKLSKNQKEKLMSFVEAMI